MCLLATSEFSHEAVKKHQETVVNALKVRVFVLSGFFVGVRFLIFT